MYKLEVDSIQRDDRIDKKSDSMRMASLLTVQKYYNLGHHP